MATRPPAYRSGDSDWRSRAVCCDKNAAFFFPPGHFELKAEKDAREAVARALCEPCPVQADCLNYALRADESHGIWGGLNELERSRLRRRITA